ncbi:MAG: FecR family protein, partial [Flavisolibacter sp.]|nr:FecR family protein [Flavisolibacter sp.]
METEGKYDAVIVRFLLNEANEEEGWFVLDWMNADEKNRLYVEGLRSTLQLIALKQEEDKINVDTEWSHFLNQLVENQHKQFQFNEFESYGNPAITDEDNQSRKAKIYKLIIASAVAASVLLVLTLGWGILNKETDRMDKAGLQARMPENSGKIDPLMAVVQHEVNTSGKMKRLRLPDGSEVALFNNSEMTYKEPVQGSKRDVYLKGKADFKVAKDKTKPFTVFSGDIATTAIGTEFMVTAVDKENQILVRLNEGKIVVRSRSLNTKWVNDFYLSPGQELTYDKRLKTAKVRSLYAKKPVDTKTKNQVQDSPSIPHYGKNSWFMFNNQSLSEIFDALSDMYDVKIEYSKKDVKNHYFIGTFDRSEPLENILHQIAILNNLTVTKEKDTYR